MHCSLIYQPNDYLEGKRKTKLHIKAADHYPSEFIGVIGSEVRATQERMPGRDWKCFVL
jgi:hypothetical protein